jgi:ribonuclease HII
MHIEIKMYRKTLEEQDWLIREKNLWNSGLSYVAGVDEAGRGCLAGPVVAAAVILPPHTDIEGIYDSKLMTPKAREQAYVNIIDQCHCVSIGASSNRDIDRTNILMATMLAMKRALNRMKIRPEYILIDGNKCPDNLPAQSEAIIGGDRTSRSIAAASIIAKVTRDRLMVNLSRFYQRYGFDKHKGYGTAQHIAAIKSYGATPHHRLSFRPIKVVS